MALPGHRHTKSKKGRRRSHLALKKRSFFVCSNCQQSVLGHRVCQNCGFYKGRQIIDVLAKLSKKEKKKREKELAAQETAKEKQPQLSLEELSRK